MKNDSFKEFVMEQLSGLADPRCKGRF